ESPVNIYCKVKSITPLGSHDMFVAEVVGITVDEAYMDENGKFDLSATDLIAYSHGEYFSLGEKLGKFGYSVKKN
ncbi:MAG: flavin reductase, partial [Parasporobacterium sp.]|nr:flavin reductase [Parasporobacterium sp.]